MNKQYLRTKYRLIRKNIKDKSKKDTIIYNKIIDSTMLNKYDVILIYVSILEEVDTIKLIKYLLNSSKKVAVPRIINNEMFFYLINDINDLKLGNFNILEPINGQVINCFDNCLCITPGICFDKNNYRIGYGKGYYDKFFKKHQVFSIGLCYSECIVDEININNNDYNVDIVVTD